MNPPSIYALAVSPFCDWRCALLPPKTHKDSAETGGLRYREDCCHLGSGAPHRHSPAPVEHAAGSNRSHFRQQRRRFPTLKTIVQPADFNEP